MNSSFRMSDWSMSSGGWSMIAQRGDPQDHNREPMIPVRRGGGGPQDLSTNDGGDTSSSQQTPSMIGDELLGLGESDPSMSQVSQRSQMEDLVSALRQTVISYTR